MNTRPTRWSEQLEINTSQKAAEPQKQWEHQREDLLIAIVQPSQMSEIMNDIFSCVKQQVDVLDNSHQANNKKIQP